MNLIAMTPVIVAKSGPSSRRTLAIFAARRTLAIFAARRTLAIFEIAVQKLCDPAHWRIYDR